MNTNFFILLLASLSIFLLGVFISIPISIISHEVGHFLAYLAYGAKPKFGFYFEDNKWYKFRPFVTPTNGNTFYFDSFLEDKKNAWKKQIVISGSGLAANLLIGLLGFVGLFFASITGANVEVSAILAFIAFYNTVIVLDNSIRTTSDGWRVIKALEKKEAYVDFLVSINYSFDSDDESFKKALERIQEET